MATEGKIRKELVKRAELLAGQGLGDEAVKTIVDGGVAAIRCWDYSNIGPVDSLESDLRSLSALLRLQDVHPGARPYYLFDYHWRDVDELDEDEEYTDEISLLYLSANEADWEEERDALAAGEPRYFAVRFVDVELLDGDGDCLDCVGSLTAWHSGIGDVLEISLEDEV